MVVEQMAGRIRFKPLDPSPIRFVADRRIETDSAARGARRLVASVTMELPGDGAATPPDEHALFVALHTCGYRATLDSPRQNGGNGAGSPWAARWFALREYIVVQNLGLVHGCVAHFSTAGLDRDELQGEGMYALVRAVDGFNPWLGLRLSTYAYNSIKRALILVGQKATRYRRLLNVSLNEYQQRSATALSRPSLRTDRVRHLLSTNAGNLSAREAAVLDWRFPRGGGNARTLGEIGGDLALSKERVRQIQVSAIDKLREVMRADPHLVEAMHGRDGRKGGIERPVG